MKENETIWNDYSIIGDTKELDHIVKSEGQINLDYDDIIDTLSASGNNYVASGRASTLSGAFKLAVENLQTTLKNAKCMLIQFVCGMKQTDMAELQSVTEMLNGASIEMSLLWGISSDSSLGEDFKVIILLSE